MEGTPEFRNTWEERVKNRPKICAGNCTPLTGLSYSGECPWQSVCDPEDMHIIGSIKNAD